MQTIYATAAALCATPIAFSEHTAPFVQAHLLQVACLALGFGAILLSLKLHYRRG